MFSTMIFNKFKSFLIKIGILEVRKKYLSNYKDQNYVKSRTHLVKLFEILFIILIEISIIIKILFYYCL